MSDLRDFVADLMECDGAMIDAVEPDGLDVMAPEPLRASLGWPELTRLGFGGSVPAGAIPIGLEGDWLDRFSAVLGERGRFAERQLTISSEVAPPGDPERMIDRAILLPNAVWRLKDIRPTWTRCLLLSFRYTAVSDEKREGLIWVGFNCATGAVLAGDMLDRMRLALTRDANWNIPDLEVSKLAGPSWTAERILARARPLIEAGVRADLDPFLGAMRRRLDRDRGRIHEYHDDLRRTALTKLAAAKRSNSEKAQTDARREALRVAAIEREYAAKLDDLRHNYALRVSVEWVQGLSLLAQVHRCDLQIKRRKGERSIAMDWHHATRTMEPAPCDWGHGLGPERVVCDEHLHLTEAAGQAPCPACRKAWCRACHPAACPRCKHPMAPLPTKRSASIS